MSAAKKDNKKEWPDVSDLKALNLKEQIGNLIGVELSLGPLMSIIQKLMDDLTKTQKRTAQLEEALNDAVSSEEFTAFKSNVEKIDWASKAARLNLLEEHIELNQQKIGALEERMGAMPDSFRDTVVEIKHIKETVDVHEKKFDRIERTNDETRDRVTRFTSEMEQTRKDHTDFVRRCDNVVDRTEGWAKELEYYKNNLQQIRGATEERLDHIRLEHREDNKKLEKKLNDVKAELIDDQHKGFGSLDQKIIDIEEELKKEREGREHQLNEAVEDVRAIYTVLQVDKETARGCDGTDESGTAAVMLATPYMRNLSKKLSDMHTQYEGSALQNSATLHKHADHLKSIDPKLETLFKQLDKWATLSSAMREDIDGLTNMHDILKDVKKKYEVDQMQKKVDQMSQMLEDESYRLRKGLDEKASRYEINELKDLLWRLSKLSKKKGGDSDSSSSSSESEAEAPSSKSTTPEKKKKREVKKKPASSGGGGEYIKFTGTAPTAKTAKKKTKKAPTTYNNLLIG